MEKNEHVNDWSFTDSIFFWPHYHLKNSIYEIKTNSSRVTTIRVRVSHVVGLLPQEAWANSTVTTTKKRATQAAGLTP